jgi:exopolysaccharide biosynthesis polyprenyl glycosylphosphotransferase
MSETLPSRRRWQLQLADRRSLLMAGDVLAVLLAVLLSFAVWITVDQRGQDLRFVLLRAYWFPLLALLWLALANANDFYNLRLTARIDTSLLRLVQITMQLLVAYLVIFFIAPRNALPRLFILYYGVLSFLMIMLWRMWHSVLVKQAAIRRRALVIGSGWAAQTIIQTLREEAPGDYEVVGLIVEPDTTLPGDPPVPVAGFGTHLLTLARRKNISEIILAHSSELSGETFQAIMDCYEQGLSIVPMPLLYEQITGRVPVEHVDRRSWTVMLPLESDSIFDLYPPIKRGMDMVLSVIGLALFTPLLPLIALAVWLDSRGPVFYRQARIGQGGRVFHVVKLRTMIPDAERETGPRWAMVNDPRITRTGRILRKTRLDEVPQLISVLRGEMSLIGPRPERPEFVRDLSENIPFYRTRHVVKPGITGWAQVRYPYGNSAADALVKLQYDLYYIRHRSLALDLLILLRTVGRMLSFQGT